MLVNLVQQSLVKCTGLYDGYMMVIRVRWMAYTSNSKYPKAVKITVSFTYPNRIK